MKNDFDMQQHVALVQRADLPNRFGVHVPGFRVTPVPEGYSGDLKIMMADHGIMVIVDKKMPPLQVDFQQGLCRPLPHNEKLRRFHAK